MPQVTANQRVQRIKQLLAELNKVPPERHEVLRLPGPAGEARMCQVITIGVEEVVLNHRSHRVRAQLEDDPEWLELRDDPFGDAAQGVVERHVVGARTPDEFAALKESLQREGQTDPGVMTHEGVLVNANTRVVALRQLDDPSKHYIRVAVLPETVDPAEQALLELRLQMQKELKVEYSLTNELLFIEELSSDRHLSYAHIALELRIHPESAKKGANEVSTRLRMLDLIRRMQQIPNEGLRLTFFDALGYEQLRDLLRSHDAVVKDDPAEAERVLRSFLLSVAVGVTPVHQMRHIDPRFISDYMLPQLEEDEIIGAFAPRLTSSASSSTQGLPLGVDALMTQSDDDAPPEQVSTQRLIDIVTQRDKRVSIDGTDILLRRDDVRDALKSAIITGIKEKRRDDNQADRLEAPIEALRNAVRQVDKCRDACSRIINTDEFDEKHRKSLEAAFRRLKRTYRRLETTLVKANVIAE